MLRLSYKIYISDISDCVYVDNIKSSFIYSDKTFKIY